MYNIAHYWIRPTYKQLYLCYIRQWYIRQRNTFRDFVETQITILAQSSDI